MGEIISVTRGLTNEEAVEYLMLMRDLYDDENGNCYIALTMAIKALEEKENE